MLCLEYIVSLDTKFDRGSSNVLVGKEEKAGHYT